MSKTYDVNKGHSNPTFISDESGVEGGGGGSGRGTTNHPHSIFMSINTETNQLSLEMKDSHNAKDNPEKLQNDKDYDPYCHRNVQHPTSNTETLIHLLKGSLGTGILAMPNAFLHAGYIVGAICTVLIGVLCTYCVHLLIKAEYELCKRKKVPCLTYPQVAECALLEGPEWMKPMAPYIKHVVNTFLLIYQLGTCCVYVVFVSSNIKSIADNYMEDKTDIRLIMLIILIPLILINWVRNLKYLAPFTTFGNVITLVSFGIICYYLFREPISMESKHAVGNLRDFPLFFGTVLFALEAIGVILPLENEMKTPKAFGGSVGVLNKAMSFIILLYTGMGFFGYLRYGESVQGSITLDLPSNEILAQCAKGMLAFAIYITHALQCYVAIDLTWNNYILKRVEKSNRKLFWEFAVRTVLVLITFLLAVAIPSLELFISLFGALCLSTLGLAFPAIMQICTAWKDIYGTQKIVMLMKNSIIILIGVVGLFVGTYTSISDIVVEFFTNKD